MAIRIIKLRIINWHFITDTGILPFTKRVFVTGRNASGKSTIIDALTTLLFVNKTDYNQANDIRTGKGDGRTLMGYIRGAITVEKEDREAGEKKKEYVRKGSTVTHIAAELLDEKKNGFYTLGVTFEVNGNRTESSAIAGKWWLAENAHLEEIPLTQFNTEGKPLVQTLEQFKRQLPEEWLEISAPRFVVFSSDSDAKRSLSALLGISAKKHGDKDDMNGWKKTMMRCVAFRPESTEMKNSDAFVRNVVLEANDVDETDLEELLDQLRDACINLAGIQARHRDLKNILDLGEEYGNRARQYRLLDHTVCLVQKLTLEQRRDSLDTECVIREAQYKEKEGQVEKAQSELQTLRDQRKELERDPAIQDSAPLRCEIESKEREIKACEEAEVRLLNILEKVKDVAGKVNHAFGEKVLDDQRVNQALAGEMLDLSELQTVRNDLKMAQDKVAQLLRDVYHEKKQVDLNIQETKEEITLLKNGRVRALPCAQTLKEIVAGAFREKNISDEPKFLYELLDYRDNRWARAIEAHMGHKALFSVVVAPENYMCAAQVFRACSNNASLAGAILIDTKAFATEEIELVDGSLAANLVTKNPFVRQYINYRYNQVVLVDDVIGQENKRGTYLDVCGMRYSNYALTRLKLPQYTMIGEASRQERLLGAQAERERLEQRSEELRGINLLARQAEAAFESGQIKDLQASAVIDQLQRVRQLSEMRADLANKQRQYQKLTNSEPFYRLRQVDKEIQKKNGEIQAAIQAKNTAHEALTRKNDEHKDTQNKLSAVEDKFNQLERDEPAAVQAAKDFLDEQKIQYPKRYLPRHEEEMCNQMKSAQDTMNKLNTDIMLKQKLYNSAYTTNLPDWGHEALGAFREAYDRINSEDLPIAHRNSELYNKQMSELLQTRLIKHLKTAITSATNTLKVLNRTLENMVYNGNYYQFSKIKPARGREKYFDVIMHSDSIMGAMQNLNLFGTIRTEDEYREEEQVIRELVENIRNQKSDKGVNWLDYRTYCEFAIEVVSANNPEMRSKLDRAVSTFSGAEVQIPFYTVLTASLVNRYAQGASLTSETIRNTNALRLMIVDECFSKMDTGNTQKLVEFICRDMGIQLIAAAPPGTFTALAGAVNDVIYVKQEQQGGRAYRKCFTFTAEEFLESADYETEMQYEQENNC